MQIVAPFAETTRFFTISTAGHVDHGKTSLLRALTGIDPDRLKEEKERQMTTDLGFAHLRLPGDLVAGFVDVPGHGRFLKNMLAGVGGLDMALLVVAADEGPMPQTVQHVRILSLLGIDKVLPVITKIDMCDEDKIKLCEEAVRALVQQHGMQIVDSVRVSSVKGIGIEDLKETLQRALQKLPRRTASGSAFLPVDRVFSKQGFGTVVTGTLVRGRLAVGDNITLAPDSVSGRVRRLETFGANVDHVTAGQRVACNLVLREQNHPIVRGFVVSGESLSPTRSLLVNIVDRPQTTQTRLVEILQDQPVRFYHGTSECHGRIRWVEEVGSPQSVLASIGLADPLAAQPQDRFVIRLADDSIFGGVILLREKPRWLSRNTSTSLCQALLSGDFKDAVLQAVMTAPQAIVREGLLRETFLPESDVSALDELYAEKQLAKLGDNLMRPQLRQSLSEQCKVAAKGDHKDKEVSLEKLRLSLKPKLDRQTFTALVDEEVNLGNLCRKGDRISLPGADAKTELSDDDLQAMQKVTSIVQEQLCIEAAEVIERLKAERVSAAPLIDSMVKAGHLVRVDREFLATPENIAKAHQVLAEVFAVKRNISPGEFREKAGTTRKYAMALLSYFDDRSVTRRLNDGRVLLKPPKA